jgi:ubiquinone/menaquinone biosynthesis C-methylase UbiE
MSVALPRTLEPEVMDSEQEASDYDAMDHEEVNSRFCEDLLAFDAHLRRALDVGTGTALIPIELCRRCAEVQVQGIDLARHMLARGAGNVARAGLQHRVSLQCVDAKATGYPAGAFDAVISNSLVHHIPDPAPALAEMWRLVAIGGVLFVRDLARPATAADAERLVAQHGPPADADPESELAAARVRQRGLFLASLHAALTVDEARSAVEPLGIPGHAIAMTSDRHWTLAYARP